MTEREIIEIGNKEMKLLKEALKIKEIYCWYCREEIKEDDKFGIFNKPTRLICNSPLCVAKALLEDEDALKGQGVENA